MSIKTSDLIAIGTYGFAFNTDNPDVIEKVIPIGYQSEKDIINEYTIHSYLSDIRCNVHVYNYGTNTMRLSNQTICPQLKNKITVQPITEQVKTVLNQCLRIKEKDPRHLGDKYYSYRIERLNRILYKLRKNTKLVYIIVYQIIEMYQCLVDSAPFVFGHHDLHAENVGCVEYKGEICAKIFDFGFACFHNDKITISTDNHPDIIYNAYQHAVLDVMHLLASLYVCSGDPLIERIICGRKCLGVCSSRASDTIFNDFYGIINNSKTKSRYAYLASQKCHLQDIVNLEKIKNIIKLTLTDNFGVKWLDDDGVSTLLYPLGINYNIYDDYVDEEIGDDGEMTV